MKLPVLFSFCLVVFAADVHAQDAAGDDPKGGTLVDCGPEKVAVFAHTESPDGRYALGWTVRPKPGQPPVDWSAYGRDQSDTFLEKYPAAGDYPFTTAYTLVDGVLDLSAGKFTPLVTDMPCWPHKSRNDLGVAWSGDDHGTLYAVASNDARFGTVNLWLVTIRAGATCTVDLAPAAARSVIKSLRARVRRGSRYETTFFTSGARGEGTSLKGPLMGRILRLHFDAEIPKSVDDPICEGEITILLHTGKIVRVTSRVSM